MEDDEKYIEEQAPTPKNFLVIILILLTLIALSWLAYYKLKWFQ